MIDFRFIPQRKGSVRTASWSPEGPGAVALGALLENLAIFFSVGNSSCSPLFSFMLSSVIHHFTLHHEDVLNHMTFLVLYFHDILFTRCVLDFSLHFCVEPITSPGALRYSRDLTIISS